MPLVHWRKNIVQKYIIEIIIKNNYYPFVSYIEEIWKIIVIIIKDN